MNLFRDFLNVSGLMDFDLKGSKFTWTSNPRDGFVTCEKLDRVLVNWAWRSLFPHDVALALPIISSDHAPIIFYPKPKSSSGYSFKFEAYWEEHEQCDATIQQGWNGSVGESNAWDLLLEKTISCQKSLRKWHHKTFKKADDKIIKLKVQLGCLMNRSNHNQNWEQIKSIQQRIVDLWKQEEIFWGQRSRLKWLNWGDRNTKFFHATTIQRRERNRVVRIKNDRGEWLDDQEEIFSEIEGHFNNVYKAGQNPRNMECLSNIPHLINSSMNEALLRQVSDSDVKEVVDALGALKAPGPDGFNGLFYQNHWGTVKDDVCNAVKSFFSECLLPPKINETVVSLIPKIPMPESINHLRPISCCNFVNFYKIISKIMVGRLKMFMDGLISQEQSAFVGGRQIQDNILVAQEIFHALKS